MAAKKNLAVDLERFKYLMNQHKIGSGSGAFLDSVMAEGPLDAVRKIGRRDANSSATTRLEAEGEVVGIIAEKQLVDQLEEFEPCDAGGASCSIARPFMARRAVRSATRARSRPTAADLM